MCVETRNPGEAGRNGLMIPMPVFTLRSCAACICGAILTTMVTSLAAALWSQADQVCDLVSRAGGADNNLAFLSSAPGVVPKADVDAAVVRLEALADENWIREWKTKQDR